jgi:hypothetical protein
VNYSNLHQGVIDKLQRSKVSTEPQNFLGSNYQAVLDFWTLLDALTEQQCIQVIDRYNALEDSTKVDGYESAWYATQDVIGHTRNGNIICYAIQDATSSVLWGCNFVRPYFFNYPNFENFRAALVPTLKTNWELIGMPKLLEEGKSLFFAPLFENL